MTFSSKEIERWLRPWPIKLRRRRWKIIVVPLRSCGKLKCFWKTGGERKTIGWWAKAAAEGEVPDDRQHYIHMLARFHAPVMTSLTAVALKRRGEWVVIDGNYHLYRRLKCPITWIGMVIPAREKFSLD